jgi:propanediol dehydratase small subunit
MSSFYKYFTDDEVTFIKKAFLSWMELEADNGELPDDIIAEVYDLLRSKRIAGLQASDEITSQAYEDFKRGR